MNDTLTDEFWAALAEKQDELIARLEELNAQIEAALAEVDERQAGDQPSQAA